MASTGIYERDRLCSVRSIDAHVLRGKVAGPVARGGGPGVQMQDNWNVLGEQAVAGGALIEIERTAAPQNRDARHLDVDSRGIELDPGAAGGGENAAPVGIAAGEGRLDERRSGDGFRD